MERRKLDPAEVFFDLAPETLAEWHEYVAAKANPGDPPADEYPNRLLEDIRSLLVHHLT